MIHRKRIGILINTFEGLYHGLLFEGFNTEAQVLDLDLIFFPGMEADRSVYTFYRSAGVVYSLPNIKNVDGIVAVGSSLFANAVEGVMEAFLSKYEGIPMTFLGDPIDICPSVGINPEPGISAAVHHLAADHGYTTFGMITGPDKGWETQQRTEVFYKALRAENLVVENRHVSHGRFTEESGAAAVDQLHEAGNLDMEALFVQSDEMAIGAILRLRELGYHIPKDIAVIGFDGISHLGSFSPPLTTVQQPIREQAAESLRMIAAMLNGERPEDKTLDTSFRVRESCGCTEADIAPSLAASSAIDRSSLHSRIIDLAQTADREVLLNEVTHYAEAKVRPEPLEDLRRQMSRLLAREDIAPETAKSVGEARDILNRRMLAIEGTELWKLQNVKWRDWMAARQGLINSSRLEDILSQLGSTLSHMKIAMAKLVLSPDPKNLAQGSLVFSYPDAGPFEAIPVADLADVIPSQQNTPTSYLVNPVYHQRDVYGYFLLRVDEHHITYFDDLRAELSRALHTMNLIKQLQYAHDRLANAERRASVGELVRGVAHEINGPIGTAITATSHIDSLVDREDLNGIREAAELAMKGLHNVKKIVAGLKGLYGEDGGISPTPFSPREWIESTIQTRSEPLPSGCSYSIQGYAGTVSNADPEDLSRIIDELLNNSVDFAGPGMKSLEISIAITDHPEGIGIRYEDNGPGIEDTIAGRLFDPFFTTARGKGHKGLGLPAIYSLAVTRYNGSITTYSPANGGLGYEITLPWPPT